MLNPLGGVDCALFQRRINVATGDLLRDDAKLSKRLAGPAADTHLNTFEVAGSLSSFLNQPPICVPVLPMGRSAH